MIGALDIALVTGTGQPAWRLTPATALDRAVCVIGRTADEAARLLPRLFNLCAAAHGEAASQALGLAGDGSPTQQQAISRQAVSRQERLRDHALALCVDWPTILDSTPDRQTLGLLGTGADPDKCRRALLGSTMNELSEATAPDLERWLRAGESPAARLLAYVRGLDPAWGRASLELPAPADIATSLEADAPICPRETTAADLWRQVPLIAALVAREGVSLFVRMLARLLDLLDCLLPHRSEPTFSTEPGIGIARAARGLLAHRARVENGRIAQYRVLAPSAWNLAPGGLLARMLDALPIGAQTPMLARLAVSCVNPCVPVSLRFEPREALRHA